jgi:hypothetical protein
MEIPKNARMCVPTNMDPVSSQKLLSAILRERMVRASLEYPDVRLKKMGLFPSGFTIGKSAEKTRRQLLTSATITSDGMNFRVDGPTSGSYSDAILKSLPPARIHGFSCRSKSATT